MAEKFTYKVAGRTIELPLITQLPPAVMRRTVGMSGMDRVFTTLNTLLGEADLEALDTLDWEGVGAFVKAWNGASGITLGESTAS